MTPPTPQGDCQSLKHTSRCLPGMPMSCRDLERDQVLPTRVKDLGDFPGLIHLLQESCPQLLALPRCLCHWVVVWGCLTGCALKFWQVVCPGEKAAAPCMQRRLSGHRALRGSVMSKATSPSSTSATRAGKPVLFITTSSNNRHPARGT